MAGVVQNVISVNEVFSKLRGTILKSSHNKGRQIGKYHILRGLSIVWGVWAGRGEIIRGGLGGGGGEGVYLSAQEGNRAHPRLDCNKWGGLAVFHQTSNSSLVLSKP